MASNFHSSEDDPSLETPVPNIRTQGDLDGSCFLYSLANAAQTLSGVGVRPDNWYWMIDALPTSKNFLTAQIGSEGPVGLATKGLQLLDPRRKRQYSVTKQPGIGFQDDWKNWLTGDTVFIVSDREHWYCIVDIDEKNQTALVACSYEMHYRHARYRQRTSKTLKRQYNRVIPLDGLKILKKYSLLVTRTVIKGRTRLTS